MIRKHLFKGLLTTLLVYSPLVHAKSLYGIVDNVADGDTITVLDSSKNQHRIRLLHIDTPERGQAYGLAAQKALSQKVSKRQGSIDYQTAKKPRNHILIMYEKK